MAKPGADAWRNGERERWWRRKKKKREAWRDKVSG